MDVESDSYISNMFRFKPVHQQMMYCYSREQSYGNWPDQIVQKPSNLARNGFFYTNFGDRVTCFYCDTTLKQWNSSDDIETEHLKWEPNCLFAKMISNKSLSSILMTS